MNIRQIRAPNARFATALWIVAAASMGSVLAQVGGAYNEYALDDSAGSELVHSLDIDGDGFQDVVILKNGVLAVGYGHAQVLVRGWDYISKEALRGEGETSSVEGHDLDGDGNDDLIVTSYRQGTVHVVWGQRSRTAPLRVEKFDVGQGPILCHAIPVVPVNPNPPDVLLMAAEAAGLRPVFRTFDPANSLTPPVTHPWNTDDDEPGLPGVTIYLDLNLNAEHHLMGAVKGSEFQYFTIELLSANIALIGDITLKRGYTSTLDWFPEAGRERLYFANWAPGVDTMELVGIDLDSMLPEVDDEVLVGFEAGDVKVLPGSDGAADKLLVTSLDGSQAAIFEYDPVNGLTLDQQLPLEPGQSFGNILPVQMAETVHLYLKGNGEQIDGESTYSVYSSNASGIYQLAASGLPLPALPALPQSPTVALKTADPFVYSPSEPLDFEFLLAGDFSTMASFGGGQVTATVETFLGSSQGLGDSQVVLLQPDDIPGPGGTAVPNSWEASSSLVYQVAPGGGGVAAVSIDPPSGTYGGVVEVNFTASPGSSVISRVGAGPWQSGIGPYFVSVDSVVEYYGEHQSGAIGPIQSAAYDIVIPADEDSNGDGITDLIAAALGLDISGGGDTDGDGVSDAVELLNGSDPLDPTSMPSRIDTPFPPSLEMTVGATTPVAGGGEAMAPNRSMIDVYNNLGRRLVGGVRLQQGRAVVDADYNQPVHGEPPPREDALLFVAWHHDELLGPEFASLLGIALPQPLPSLEPPPPPASPLPISYPTPTQIDEWVEGTKTIIGGFKSVAGMDGSVDVVEVDIATTTVSLAFATWVRDGLEAGGRGRPAFPWDDADDFGSRLSREDLDFLEEPQGPGLLVHELAHVVQQMHDSLTETAAFAPLIQTAREIYLAWEEEFLIMGDPDRPVIIGAAPNPVAALGEFFETGVIPPAYASDVTTPVPELVALRDLLLQAPTSRPVLDLTGVLSRDQIRGDWVFQYNQSDIAFLKQRAVRVGFEDAGTGILSHRPFRFPFDMDPYEGADVRVIGFATENQKEIVVYQIIIITDVGTAPKIDNDLDGIDDRYEVRFLATLATGFWDDTDLDGLVNGREYREGTDAGDPSSTPSGEPALPRALDSFFDGDMLVVEWEGSEAASYVVSINTDLGIFTPSPQLPTQPFPGVPFYRWTSPIAGDAPRLFYRVDTTLNP